MEALSLSRVRDILSYRRQGFAYKKIAKQLCLSSSSVYKYAKTIQLSGEQRQVLKENEIKNWRAFVAKNEKDIKLPVLDENFANLLGHLFFDGSVFHSRNGNFCLNFTNSSKKATSSFLEKISFCFGLAAPKIYKTNGKNVDYFEVSVSSKKAYFFLKARILTFSTSKGARVPELIKSASPEIKAAFLRAFWDDEGCIDNDGDLSGTSASEKMIDDLILIHVEFGIICRKEIVRQPDWVNFRLVVFRNKENFDRFISQIGFEHAIVTKGYNIGRFKSDVLAEKYAQKYRSGTLNV